MINPDWIVPELHVARETTLRDASYMLPLVLTTVFATRSEAFVLSVPSAVASASRYKSHVWERVRKSKWNLRLGKRKKMHGYTQLLCFLID